MLVKAKQPPEDRAQLPEGMTHGVCTQKTLDTQPRPDPRASYCCLWDQTQGQRVGKNAQVSFCEMRHSHYLQAGEWGSIVTATFQSFQVLIPKITLGWRRERVVFAENIARTGCGVGQTKLWVPASPV